MDFSRASDIRVVITSPPGAADSPAFTPFDWPTPDLLVLVVFLRDEDQRATLLRTLRDEAALAARDGADLKDLAAGYARAHQSGRETEALCQLVRWRAGVLREAFHTYNLRVAFAPYRTSCLISFSELAPPDLRANVERAMRVIENDKSRLLDAFGLAHYLRSED
jgi:hypothetical protein